MQCGAHGGESQRGSGGSPRANACLIRRVPRFGQLRRSTMRIAAARSDARAMEAGGGRKLVGGPARQPSLRAALRGAGRGSSRERRVRRRHLACARHDAQQHHQVCRDGVYAAAAMGACRQGRRGHPGNLGARPFESFQSTAVQPGPRRFSHNHARCGQCSRARAQGPTWHDAEASHLSLAGRAHGRARADEVRRARTTPSPAERPSEAHQRKSFPR